MKVLALVDSCLSCPNRVYDSGTIHRCKAADTRLTREEEHGIPAWCPLADYPSNAMHEQGLEIQSLRRELEQARAALAAKAA